MRDWTPISRLHVYYALTKLAATRFVREVNQANGARARKVYTLLPERRDAIAKALADPAWAANRAPSPFDTWLGLSIHAASAVVDQTLTARRHFLEAELAKERQTLRAIELDTGQRSQIAAIMVKLTVRKFEIEISSLLEMQAKL